MGLGLESKALVHWCSKTHVPWGRCWGQITAFEPHYPQHHGRPGLQMTCEKRGHLFISQQSFIKKKTWGKFHLCFLVEFRFLAQTAWSFLFLSSFSIKLVLGHLLTHSLTNSLNQSINQSIKLLTHSRPKIEFYLFAIAHLPTVFPPTQLFFCLSRILLFSLYHFLAEIPKLHFFFTRKPQDH